jgi:MTH538 TIR-like domain (DUF1863)
MPKKCFYSFHYKPDNWRASKVRQIGAIEGSQTVSDNDWESVTRGGDSAIEKWVADQMHGRGCTILLIGSATAGRKWINHEIIKTWNDKKGIVGIYVHNLLDREQKCCGKGANPLSTITLGSGGASLAAIAKAYDPPYTQSADVYKFISDNVETWVDEAIAIRNRY